MRTLTIIQKLGALRVQWLVSALLVLLPGVASAQSPIESFVGTYDGGQIEIAAALRLDRSGRFEYDLSYGALDEMATGTWQVIRDGVVLNSDPVTAPTFELTGIQPLSEGIVLKVDMPKDLPRGLLSAVIVFSDGTTRESQFNDDRTLWVEPAPNKHVIGLVLQLSLYDLVSPRYDVSDGGRALTFRFEPNDLGKVAFDHQVLKRDSGSLVLERFDRTIRFRKQH